VFLVQLTKKFVQSAKAREIIWRGLALSVRLHSESI